MYVHTDMHTHTATLSFPSSPPPSPALFSPSILRLTVRVDAGWKAVSGAIVPRGQRESEIHNARVGVTAVMARPLGSTVLLSQMNHSWEKKYSGKERGRKKEEWVQRAECSMITKNPIPMEVSSK